VVAHPSRATSPPNPLSDFGEGELSDSETGLPGPAKLSGQEHIKLDEDADEADAAVKDDGLADDHLGLG
jgi:hypothetical protein